MSAAVVIVQVAGVLCAPLMIYGVRRHVALGVADATGLGLAAVAVGFLVCWRFASDPALGAWWWLALTGLGLVVIDTACYRLPHLWVVVLLAGGVLVFFVVCLTGGQWEALGRAVTAGIVTCAAASVLRWAVPEHLGGGDCRLAAALAVFLGWIGWRAVLLGVVSAGLLLGLHAGCVWLAGRRSGRIPAGPGLIAATWISVIATAIPSGGIR